MPATVDATVEACGQFQPVMATRAATPEYVALIERFHRDDHVSRLATAATNRLRAEGVAFSDYFFGYAPQICRDATGRAVSLDKLTEAASDRHLVVIGTADGFFDPLTEEPEPWISKLAAWRDRTLFSARRIRHWGPGEAGLLDEGLNLTTVTPRGIVAYSDIPVDHSSESGGALLEGRRVAPSTAPSDGRTQTPPLEPANNPRAPGRLSRPVAALGAISAVAASLLIAYVATPVFDPLLGPGLPMASPYVLSAEKNVDGTIVAEGHAPDGDALKLIEEGLVAQARSEPRIDISLARGVPFDTWGDDVSTIITALEKAEAWRTSFRDSFVGIEGDVRQQETRVLIQTELESILAEMGIAGEITLRLQDEAKSDDLPSAAEIYAQIMATERARVLPQFSVSETGDPAASRIFTREAKGR
ncbi:MAG: hypothetical protein AAFP68_15905 [Pseudomonadota bacterium]